MEDYHSKYLKYKTKYINQQYGNGVIETIKGAFSSIDPLQKIFNKYNIDSHDQSEIKRILDSKNTHRTTIGENITDYINNITNLKDKTNFSKEMDTYISKNVSASH
jgi:hypothetical protein